jgi:hypothetical protein
MAITILLPILTLLAIDLAVHASPPHHHIKDLIRTVKILLELILFIFNLFIFNLFILQQKYFLNY